MAALTAFLTESTMSANQTYLLILTAMFIATLIASALELAGWAVDYGRKRGGRR